MDRKTKSFDCVAMKHKGADAIRRRIRGLTIEQELAFWNESDEKRTTAKTGHGRASSHARSPG